MTQDFLSNQAFDQTQVSLEFISYLLSSRMFECENFESLISIWENYLNLGGENGLNKSTSSENDLKVCCYVCEKSAFVGWTAVLKMWLCPQKMPTFSAKAHFIAAALSFCSLWGRVLSLLCSKNLSTRFIWFKWVQLLFKTKNLHFFEASSPNETWMDKLLKWKTERTLSERNKSYNN